MDPATLLLLAAAAAVAVFAFSRSAGVSRGDRELRAEEQEWVARGTFPAEVRRAYGRHALELLDRPRMGLLGYTAAARERRDRAVEVVWRAERPPAMTGGGGDGDA